MTGTYNTMGQHVLAPQSDQLLWRRRLPDWGAVYRRRAGFAIKRMKGRIRSICRFGGHGCFPGNVQLGLRDGFDGGDCCSGDGSAGTQGEGRYLIDKNPAKVIYDGDVDGQGRAAAGGAWSDCEL